MAYTFAKRMPPQLKQCKDCKSSVSKSAKVCPTCGAKQGVGICGCLTAIAIFPFLAAIVIGVSSTGGGNRTSVGTTPTVNQPVQKSASFEAGYEHGFIVGEARKNNGETGLDSQRLNLMAGVNAQSHAESAPGLSEADFKSGFLNGYQVGYKGLDRSANEQLPLPELPITVTDTQTVATEDMGKLTSSSKSPYDVLSLLIHSKSGKDVYVVTARIAPNKNHTTYSKYIYDASRRIFLKLDRSDTLGENTYSWSVSFDVRADNVSESGIWGMESNLRQIRSQYGKAKATVPVLYKNNRTISSWP